ncbi:GEVED domain-containing protein [Tenacibaculum pacificus]|uniref:GEVED domain-containing protein n=1 Tax=Tenacibaculum pacificus TaxID=3018314 RepID=UPI0022F4021A|nr:GEVED domain-containing protein [Tenacibaculum pacificus]WBX74103.1 GEVED domain-containing protein [Tenacibaculum pacificus]
MIKKIPFLILLIFTFFSSNSFSQNYWNKTVKKDNFIQKNKILDRENTPQKYSLASLNLSSFENHLKNSNLNKGERIITLPNSEGRLEEYSFNETPSLAPELAAKFPMIKTYSAQGINNPTAVAKITLGVNGLHALIYSANESTIYIDPYTKDKKQYIIYKRDDLKSDNNDFNCQIEETKKEIIKSSIQKKNANDGKLRTYRIAIACTGEYSQFHLNREGISNSATDAVKKSVILSAMNTTIARVNTVYERDLGVRMVIVNNNDEIIFLDSTTDELTNDNADNLIDESQVKCDAIIGDANYDIGHTFSTGGGGLAALRSVCRSGSKASGITGSWQPINDPFDIDYVAREIGHQFGATHTFNGTGGSCGSNIGSTSVEPGSGTTIMAYAGICSPQNVQNNSDDYFHTVSIGQMWNHVQSVASCGLTTDTGNNAPTANAGNDFSIPKNTPFVLKGIATDTDGTASLTYNWEQIDTESAIVPLVSTSTQGPAFRSLHSSTSPNRYLPTFSNVVNDGSNQWEVLPSVARELNFALTVRDNHAGGGNTARDDVKITITDSEAFAFTYPNTAVNWNTSSTQKITWNKGTTDKAPINCMKVNIKLSIDGGLTFPILLKDNVANDGSEDVIIPNTPTTKGRILIEAADNIFYNVNNTNFTIDSTTPTFLISNQTDKQVVCNTGNNSVDYTLKFKFVNGFTETVNLSATGLPSGTTASFNPATINKEGDVVMTINNLNGSNQQDNVIIIEGKSATVTQTTTALLKITENSFTKINLTTPSNATDEISINTKFEWEANSNATLYNIVVATDTNFNNIIIDEIVDTNSYIPSIDFLSKNTNYFWRVKPKNNCSEGTYSDINIFTTEIPTYCSLEYPDETGGAEYISNVTFNTINNNSLNDSVDGYQDFSNISTNIKRTQEREISVTFNTDGYQDHCYVFIDWNQDYVFDKATERYDLGARTSDIATTSLKITVPNNAVLGKTRMRVTIEYYETGSPSGGGPCNADQNSQYGETEDYSIEIEEKPGADFTLTNTTGNLSICNKAVNDQIFEIDYKALFNFDENVSFSVSGTPTNTTSNLNPISINTSGLIKFTLSNLNNAPIGDYTIIVTGTANSITKSIEVPFNVNDNICNATGNTDSQISTTLVKFGEINNPSTKTTGYSDFKTIATEVIKGEKYPLIVNANSNGNQTVKTFAWIDWNQNCLFDTNEKYDLGNTTNNNGATANSGLKVIVPSDALSGTTTLRVITKLANDGQPNSCEIDFNGEAEDYTITITPSFTLTNKTVGQSICNKAVNEVEYKIDYKTFNSFDENVTLSTENTPVNSIVTFTSAIISTDGMVTLKIDNLNNVTVGDYTIKVNATSNSITKSIDLILSINDNHCKSSGNTDSQISTTLVKLGEIDNSSTKTTGYSDFKAITTEVIKGNTYPLIVNANSSGNKTVNTFAWIDWNQNCLFDANEKYDLGNTTNTNGATSNSGLDITIPSDALSGTTTLRVVTKLDDDGEPSSCELDFNGEVEDYTITITPSFTLTNKTVGQSICNKAVNEVKYEIDYKTFNDFNENVTLSAENAPVSSTVTFTSIVINSDKKVSITVSNLNNVAIGDYTIKVNATSSSMTKSVDLTLVINNNHCKSSGNTDSQISITNVNFGEIDNSSTKTTGYSDFKAITTNVVRGEEYDLNVDINTDGNSTVKTYAWIDWNQDCKFDVTELETYNLTTTNSLSIKVPEDALTGTTTLRISTKLNEFPESCELDFNGEVEDYTINVEESFANDKNLFSDLKIYPIPSDGKITVKFKVKVKDLTIIRLFNMVGQLLETQTFSTISSKFNNEIEFSKISSGVYFIQIQNDGKINTSKIIIL